MPHHRAHFRLAALLAHARVIMAPAARHFIMLDDPGFLFASRDEFLAGPGARVAPEGR